MVNIYARYTGKYTWKDIWGFNTSTGPIASSLADNRLFVNGNLSFKYTTRDLYSSYEIKEDSLIDIRRHGRLYRSQLNFTLYCLTTASGISLQHMNSGPELLKSIYRFHIYYGIRRIFSVIGAAVPGETGFDKGDNVYDEGGMRWLCREFGVEFDGNFLSAKLEESFYGRKKICVTYGLYSSYQPKGYKVSEEIKNSVRLMLNKLILNQNPVKYVLRESRGITDIGATWLSASARAYVYLLLTAQSAARSSFGSGRDPEVVAAFSSALEGYAGRKYDIGEDIKRFEGVLDMAGSAVNFFIGQGVYMVPGNMVLKMGGSIAGYNNHVLISSMSNVGFLDVGNVGKVVNNMEEPTMHRKVPDIPAKVSSNKERNEGYEREIVAAGILLTFASSLFIGFYG